MGIHGPLQTRGETRCPGGVSVSCLASRTRRECPGHNKGYIWRLDTGWGPILYRKCHNHNTPGKRHNNTWVEPSQETVLPAPHGKGNKCDKNVKYKRTDALSLSHQQQSTTVDIHGPLQTRGKTRCPGGVSVSCLASRTRHECPGHNKGYIWRLDTGWGKTLNRKCHNHNTPGKRHNNTSVEPLAGNCTTSYTRQREQVWQKCKIQKNWCTVTVAPTTEHHGWHSRTPANKRSDKVPGRSQRLLLS